MNTGAVKKLKAVHISAFMQNGETEKEDFASVSLNAMFLQEGN